MKELLIFIDELKVKMKQFDIAIVGSGGHIFQYYQTALNRNEEFNLVAVCDIDRSKAGLADVPFYDKLDDLLKNVKLDVIVVATPARTHYDIAKIILERGINVAVEKPATQSLLSFDELSSIADKEKVLLYSGYHWVNASDAKWFNDYYHNHAAELGPITGFLVEIYDPSTTEEGELKRTVDAYVGAWNDNGINAISMIKGWVPAIRVEKASLTKVPEYSGEISSFVEFSFGDGYGQVYVDLTQNKNQKRTRLDFADSRTSILLDHSNTQIVRVKKGQKEILAKFDLNRMKDHYIGLMQDLYLALRRKEDNRTFSRECLQLLFDAYSLLGK